MGRSMDLKVERKHYKASVSVVSGVHVYSVHSHAHVHIHLDAQCTYTCIYMYMYLYRSFDVCNECYVYHTF